MYSLTYSHRDHYYCSESISYLTHPNLCIFGNIINIKDIFFKHWNLAIKKKILVKWLFKIPLKYRLVCKTFGSTWELLLLILCQSRDWLAVYFSQYILWSFSVRKQFTYKINSKLLIWNEYERKFFNIYFF